MQTQAQIIQNQKEIEDVINDMGWDDAGVDEFISSYLIKNLDKSESIVLPEKNKELEDYLNASRFTMYR